MFDLAFDFANVHDDIYFNLNCHFQASAAQKVSFCLHRCSGRIWVHGGGHFGLSTSNLRFWYLLGLGSMCICSNKQIPCEFQCWFYAASRTRYGSATIEGFRGSICVNLRVSLLLFALFV